MYLLQLSVLLGLFFTRVTCGSSLTEEKDGSNGYYLYFSPSGYTWERARQECTDTFSQMIASPYNDMVKTMVDDWGVEGDLWATDSLNRCLTLKIKCLQTSSSIVGVNICTRNELAPAYADCSVNKHYVICTSVLTTTPLTTTTTTVTTTTTTAPTTTTPTTTMPTDTTALPQHDIVHKRPIDKGPSQNGSSLLTPGLTGEKSAAGAAVGGGKSTHLGGMAGFMLGLTAAKTDLLGLIIGVVVGTFFILSLICILCCACQGQNPRGPRQYDSIDKESDNSLATELKNGSNASTNTLEGPYKAVSTEESSIEMSDVRSQSTKQSDHEVLLSAYPPPPTLYDTTPNVYNILPVNQHQTRRNPLYGMAAETVRDSAVSQDLPLPPPPLPPHTAHVVAENECEEETCVRGLTPSFKCFLDKTIAVKPLTPHLNRSPPHSPVKTTLNERKGLITSDL